MKSLLTMSLLFNLAYAQYVGVGTTSPQAALEVTSTTSGFLPPRMTAAQRDAISPLPGMIIYCTDCKQLQLFTDNWKTLVSSYLPNGEITICSQTWKDKNLSVSTYRDGSVIPQVTNQAEWAALTTGAYCYYNNDSATYAATYGKLYNWYAVNDARGLAPTGWHIPTSAELTTLSNCLGGDAVSGGALKEIGTTHWTTPNLGATNSSGFTGLPGGYRFSDGSFNTVNNYGYYWTATETNATQGWYRTTRYTQADFNLNFTNKAAAFSVRILKD